MSASARLYVNSADRPALARVGFAHTWRARLVGLLGRRSLAADEALWIRPCSSVHTLGMRFAIDVAFLDAADRVVKLSANLRPRRVAMARATSALEMPAGSIARLGLALDDQLTFRPAAYAAPAQGCQV